MKKKYVLMAGVLFSQALNVSWAAEPAQCYVYLTELVRSSNFPFSARAVTPQQVNLIIDQDDEAIIRAKLVIETEGTGTLGWVVFEKDNQRLYNTTSSLEKPEVLKFNNEHVKAWNHCLRGEVVWQVTSKGRLYLYHIEQGQLHKTKTFVIKGDYLHRYETRHGYSHISYQTTSGDKVYGWVDSESLRKVDFEHSW